MPRKESENSGIINVIPATNDTQLLVVGDCKEFCEIDEPGLLIKKEVNGIAKCKLLGKYVHLVNGVCQGVNCPSHVNYFPR